MRMDLFNRSLAVNFYYAHLHYLKLEDPELKATIQAFKAALKSLPEALTKSVTFEHWEGK